jgi:hypothetical protein
LTQTQSLSDQKTCFKCGKTKTRADFYAHPQMSDGLLGKCKDCTKNDSAVRRIEKIEEVREYDRQRASLPHRIALRNRITKEWRTKNPQGYKAHDTVNNAIRDGKLVRKPCEVCGNEKSQAHHEDYSKPLEVVWLCKPHHFEADEKRRERERASAATA